MMSLKAIRASQARIADVRAALGLEPVREAYGVEYQARGKLIIERNLSFRDASNLSWAKRHRGGRMIDCA